MFNLDNFIDKSVKVNFKKIITYLEYIVFIVVILLFLIVFLILNLKIELTIPIEKIYSNNIYILNKYISEQHEVGENIWIKANGQRYKAKIETINYMNNNFIITVGIPLDVLANKKPRLIIAKKKIINLLF